MTGRAAEEGGCDEDKYRVGGALGRDIVGCWRSLLAPQREGTIGCSANLHLIGEKRARRGHNPGVIGSKTASAGARAATSTNGGSSAVRAADNTRARAHAGTSIAAGRGPAARATDSSTSIADGSNTIIPLTDTDAG